MGIGPEYICVVGIEAGTDQHSSATRSSGTIEQYSYSKNAILKIQTLNDLTPVEWCALWAYGALWSPGPLRALRACLSVSARRTLNSLWALRACLSILPCRPCWTCGADRPFTAQRE